MIIKVEELKMDKIVDCKNIIYENGYIYKLSNDLGEIYYGSTNHINRRFRLHKSKKTINYPFDITILETHNDICKFDLLLIERNYILNNDCINKSKPLGRYFNDYEQKQTRKDYKKKWKTTKKECDCGRLVSNCHFNEHLRTELHKKRMKLIKS